MVLNILILTGRFGFGHYSAALSIKEKILKDNPTYNVIILDFIEYIFPYISKIIYNGFNFLVNKCHTIYNIFNRVAAKKSRTPLKMVIIKKIESLLNENKIDLIISVVPMSTQYISAYKRFFNNKIPLNTCITDVDVHEEWISDETDYYFVADNKTKDNLIKMNVLESKIIVSGIPVKEEFVISKKTNKKNILIMGGGLGLIPKSGDLLEKLNNNKDINVTIIVGKNKKLYYKCLNKYKNIKVIGFTQEVYKYMDDADLIITKAGGITLFEAINSETPMFVINPFLTQEMGNAFYIEEKNIGNVLWNKNNNVYEELIKLLEDRKKLKIMSHNMKIIKNDLLDIPYTIINKREVY